MSKTPLRLISECYLHCRPDVRYRSLTYPLVVRAMPLQVSEDLQTWLIHVAFTPAPPTLHNRHLHHPCTQKTAHISIPFIPHPTLHTLPYPTLHKNQTLQSPPTIPPTRAAAAPRQVARGCHVARGGASERSSRKTTHTRRLWKHASAQNGFCGSVRLASLGSQRCIRHCAILESNAGTVSWSTFLIDGWGLVAGGRCAAK